MATLNISKNIESIITKIITEELAVIIKTFEFESNIRSNFVQHKPIYLLTKKFLDDLNYVYGSIKEVDEIWGGNIYIADFIITKSYELNDEEIENLKSIIINKNNNFIISE